MASYLKDKRIEIWRENYDATDKNGFPIVTEEKIHSGKLWAYYRHTSSKEYYAAMAAQYEEEAIFIINYRDDIRPITDYILYKGQRYKINGVDDFDGRKGDTKISAKVDKVRRG